MPTAPRDPKALSEWMELDYYRRPRRIKRVKRWLVWGALFASALALAAFAWVPRSKLIYQAGPVSQAHAMFNHDCALCHTAAFQPVKRLWQGSESIRSVMDEACLKCHDGPIHSPLQQPDSACASCHKEHRGQSALAHVRDEHCTSCHANLPEHCKATSRLQNVAGFPAGHPEFALWREKAPHDAAALHFNHQLHLNLNLDAGPTAATQAALTKLKAQQCSYCHQPDATRQHFQPLNYQQHCAACHPLTVTLQGDWADKKVQAAAAAFQHEPAPHVAPAGVRAALRERLLQFIQQHPAVLDPQSAAEPDRPLPGRRGPPVVNEQEWHWTHRQLQQAERVLFDGKAGCAHCHTERTPAKRTAGLPDYAPTSVPDRWLLKSFFHHETHRFLNCAACHERALTSTQTRDVLLPRLPTCQACHAPQAGARTDCVECHRYHDHRQERSFNGSLRIGESLGQPAGNSQPE